jgi:hypothetical protein
VGDVARRFPGSPLAADFEAGGAGIFPTVTFPLGVIGAVAIPALMRNDKRSRSQEATAFLARLYDGVTVYAQESGQLPGPSSEMTPPAGSCCQGPDGNCAANPGLLKRPPWLALKYSVDDPHYYSYQYEVARDGKSFAVRAVGDLDCDGEKSSFEMSGRLGLGGTVSPPPPIAKLNALE